MATLKDLTLPNDGAVDELAYDAAAIAETWNVGRRQLNEILAKLANGQLLVVTTSADLADHGPLTEDGAVAAIVTGDRTLWANWGASTSGVGTVAGTGGRWVRISPTTPRALFYDERANAIAPGQDQEIILAQVTGRVGAYGQLEIRFSVSGWVGVQTSEGVTRRLRLHVNGTTPLEVTLPLTGITAGHPVALDAVHNDYPGEEVEITLYGRGVEATTSTRRLLTARAD